MTGNLRRRSTTGVLGRLRRFYWQRLRRYSYEVCDECGRPVAARAFGFHRDAEGVLTPRTYWFADNHVWNTVIGGEAGVRCPECFTDAAYAAGIPVGWRCGVVGEIEPDVKPSSVSPWPPENDPDLPPQRGVEYRPEDFG